MSRLWWAWCLAGWSAVLGGGFWLLLDYDATPGVGATTPLKWPPTSGVPRPDSDFRLLLFAHPQCSCTRATLAELARVMARRQDRLTATVLFICPSDPAKPWNDTALWRQAAAIDGIRVVWDDGGVEARRFGVNTSGHVLVYDRADRLRFSGGITSGRGHEGDNAGSDAVLALVAGRTDGSWTTPVFGCPLGTSCESCRGNQP
jgi:hypothetical protein